MSAEAKTAELLVKWKDFNQIRERDKKEVMEAVSTTNERVRKLEVSVAAWWKNNAITREARQNEELLKKKVEIMDFNKLIGKAQKNSLMSTRKSPLKPLSWVNIMEKAVTFYHTRISIYD